MQPLSASAHSILTLLSHGRSTEAVLAERPDLAPADIAAAAAEALTALATHGEPRIETREERIQRLRLEHPRAYEPWTEEEDARLLFRFHEGLKVAELARAFGRQPNAIRARLEKWLGKAWRDMPDDSETKPRP